ncbi:Uncharacterised protein [Bordetella pertussis]|nr:Uncharacterised protein [Bordetella pertussis]
MYRHGVAGRSVRLARRRSGLGLRIQFHRRPRQGALDIALQLLLALAIVDTVEVARARQQLRLRTGGHGEQQACPDQRPTNQARPETVRCVSHSSRSRRR